MHFFCLFLVPLVSRLSPACRSVRGHVPLQYCNLKKRIFLEAYSQGATKPYVHNKKRQSAFIGLPLKNVYKVKKFCKKTSGVPANFNLWGERRHMLPVDLASRHRQLHTYCRTRAVIQYVKEHPLVFLFFTWRHRWGFF